MEIEPPHSIAEISVTVLSANSAYTKNEIKESSFAAVNPEYVSGEKTGSGQYEKNKTFFAFTLQADVGLRVILRYYA